MSMRAPAFLFSKTKKAGAPAKKTKNAFPFSKKGPKTNACMPKYLIAGAQDQLWHAEAVKNTTVEYYWLDAGTLAQPLRGTAAG